MPKILDRLVRQLLAKGMSESQAYAIAVKKQQEAGNLQKGSTKPTKKGIKRGNMTPAERAKDRASKYSKGEHSPSEYKYNAQKNTSKLRKKT